MKELKANQGDALVHSKWRRLRSSEDSDDSVGLLCVIISCSGICMVSWRKNSADSVDWCLIVSDTSSLRLSWKKAVEWLLLLLLLRLMYCETDILMNGVKLLIISSSSHLWVMLVSYYHHKKVITFTLMLIYHVVASNISRNAFTGALIV